MARMVLTGVLVVLLTVLAGCYSIDSGASQLRNAPKVETAIVQGSEVDIVEKVIANRTGYQQYLESLIAYYEGSGNNMKLQWAKTELQALKKIPQYTYILDATVAGANLKAADSIELASYVYEDILRQEKRAKSLLIIYDEDSLRQVIGRYNELIRKYPTSDKIDDAAYHCGEICEYFKDYTIAVLYYQRSFQWNPNTPYFGRLRAAYVLDQGLSRRSEALELYQEGLKQKNVPQNYKEHAESRIEELTKSHEKLKD